MVWHSSMTWAPLLCGPGCQGTHNNDDIIWITEGVGGELLGHTQLMTQPNHVFQTWVPGSWVPGSLFEQDPGQENHFHIFAEHIRFPVGAMRHFTVQNMQNAFHSKRPPQVPSSNLSLMRNILLLSSNYSSYIFGCYISLFYSFCVCFAVVLLQSGLFKSGQLPRKAKYTNLRS